MTIKKLLALCMIIMLGTILASAIGIAISDIIKAFQTNITELL